jgi:hypothetical protein
MQINSHTDGDQEQVVITALEDGGYVIVWQSENQDGSGYGIYTQRFDADGERVGGETLVNTHTDSNQMIPAVDALEDGSYVITWQSANQKGEGFEAYSKIFNVAKDGSVTTSDEILVNQSVEGDQTLPMVAGLEDGGYVASWISADGDDNKIVMQRFDSEGNRVGAEVIVDQLVELDHFANVPPEVTGLDGGGYVVVWVNKDSDGSGVFFQRYDENGEAQGDKVLINTDESANQYNVHVTDLHDGGFMTTWVDVAADNSSMEVIGQKFDANGNAVDDAFTVSEITSDSAEVSRLLGLDDQSESSEPTLDFDRVTAEIQGADGESITIGQTARVDSLDIKDMLKIAADSQDEIKMDLLEDRVENAETKPAQDTQNAEAQTPNIEIDSGANTQDIINDLAKPLDIDQF